MAESKPDPWIHRSAKMRCRTCMYCVPKQQAIPGIEPILGRCRRHAPTMSGFPVVFLDLDFCGDHKLDEGSLTLVGEPAAPTGLSYKPE